MKTYYNNIRKKSRSKWGEAPQMIIKHGLMPKKAILYVW